MREVTPDEAMSLLIPSDETSASANPNDAFFARMAKAGQPIREMKSADPNDPVVRSLGRQSNPARTPGALTQAAMSFATNPKQQARIGKGMGADIAGLRMGDNGKIEGVTEQGVPFPLQPEFGMGTLPSWVASGAGGVPAMAGGIAGGMAAGPGSLVAGPALAGGGAALGDLARQGIAAWMDPKVGFNYSPGQTATEAAFGAGGQALGAVAGRMIAPRNPGLAPKELASLRTGPTMANARAAYAAAKAEGVPITPGQATGLPSLLAREDVAARSPWGMDTAAEFYGRQGEALAGAGQRAVAGVSPVAAANKTDAALRFGDQAAEAGTRIRQQGNVLAREAYNAADAAPMPSPHGSELYQAGENYRLSRARGYPAERPEFYIEPYGRNVPPPNGGEPFRLYDILGTPDGQSAYNSAVMSAANDGTKIPSLREVAAGETIPFRGWDHMKKVLQGQAQEAARAGNNYRATQFTDMANAIKNEVIQVNPAYAYALEITAPYQSMARELAESAVGRSGDIDASARARQILAPVFQQSNPEFVKAARQAFIDVNGESSWNAGTGAFIKDEIERASTNAAGLNASMLRRNLFGKEDTRAVLESAMSPEQFKGLSRFMDTVENVARTFPQNSLTQPRAAMAKQMEAEAATGPVVRAGQVLGNLGPMSILKTPERLGARIAEWGTERNLRASLDYLFTPDGLPILEALAKAKPGTQNAISIAGQVMGRAVSPNGSATTPTISAPAPRKSVEELLLQ